VGEPWGKVVVTGGAGFIGSHVVDRLLAEGCAKLVVVDNLNRGSLRNLSRHRHNPHLDFVQGDIRDRSILAEAVRQADVIFHLAAQSTVMGAARDPDYSFETNVIGTFNVLSAARERSVQSVIFASSREVYGDPIELPVAEDQPLLAVNAYGASKVAGEAFCRACRRTFGLNCVPLRLSNVFGPRDFGRVIPVWLDRAAAGEDLEVYGGKQVIDFVWVGQVVQALLRAAQVPGPLPAINVGSGTGTRIVDLARRIRRLQGGRGRIVLLPARPIEVTRYIANVERMQQMLGVRAPEDPLTHVDGLAAAMPQLSDGCLETPGSVSPQVSFRVSAL
jgi:UDP-glucose 4-epimerase